MAVFRRRVSFAVLVLAVLLVAAVVAGAASSSVRLTGTWSGRLSGGRPLRIVVDASERGGSWRVSARCEGPLRLKDISGGFHHYTEELAPGATCQGGGIDCLKRAGANLYDEFQPNPGTSYVNAGTLHRVRRR